MVNNPHLQAANVGKYDYKMIYGDYHVTQATLALAYSQDTANLIAWRNGKMWEKHHREADKEINKRLGLV